ncbi:hypothetical protein [uncultured Tateyamaria sp.]|uniref:hypothetical protein n=1 Tax=uncultured Tateyamaria sp. TaxID=455651 RepID=UPI002629F1BD|nr:hypothetical protein [uncultured Tateyamaria sp.]
MSNDYERATNFRTTLTSAERERVTGIETKVRIALAELYGQRLADMTKDMVVHTCVLQPDIMVALHGGRKPASAGEWREIVREACEREPIAMANLQASDVQLRAELEQDVYDQKDPHRRIALHRSGEWDAVLENEVDRRLDDRLRRLN